MIGPTLRFHTRTLIALTGAQCGGATLDGQPVGWWQSIQVSDGVGKSRAGQGLGKSRAGQEQGWPRAEQWDGQEHGCCTAYCKLMDATPTALQEPGHTRAESASLPQSVCLSALPGSALLDTAGCCRQHKRTAQCVTATQPHPVSGTHTLSVAQCETATHPHHVGGPQSRLHAHFLSMAGRLDTPALGLGWTSAPLGC